MTLCPIAYLRLNLGCEKDCQGRTGRKVSRFIHLWKQVPFGVYYYGLYFVRSLDGRAGNLVTGALGVWCAGSINAQYGGFV